MLHARLILDPPLPPPANMARDEALLDLARLWTLRRALWAEPAATLGRFQRYVEFDIAGARRPSIRRITGGGAILHHGECTLALVAPIGTAPFPSRAPEALAARAAEGLLAALAHFARGLRLRGGPSDEPAQRAIEDCFLRASPWDIVARDESGERKLAGFALHRRGDRVLVQASALRAPIALEPDGDRALLEAWARALGGAVRLEVGALSPEEEARADHLIAARYGREEWNLASRPRRAAQ